MNLRVVVDVPKYKNSEFLIQKFATKGKNRNFATINQTNIKTNSYDSNHHD